ncbi:hypothetical protein ACFWJN_11125, partial [Streptomyces albidochromogenes]
MTDARTETETEARTETQARPGAGATTPAGPPARPGCARATRTGVDCAGPPGWTDPPGVRTGRPAPGVFELSRDSPGDRPVYYRVGPGRVEWGEDLRAFLADGPHRPPRTGHLLALVHGTVPSPDATLLPDVRRLAVGTVVRVDAAGVTVTRQRPEPAEPGTGLAEAVGRALDGLNGEYAIAYSGGLASAFVAVSALAAGHRPVLLHADFGGARGGGAPVVPSPVPGLEIRRVPVDPARLFAHEPVSGREPLPPLPDTEVPRRLMDRLSESCGLPVVSGGLLKDLVSARLPEAGTGYRGWRLLGCEPFHVNATLRGLAEARRLLGGNTVFPPGAYDREPAAGRPPGRPGPPGGTGAPPRPGL